MWAMQLADLVAYLDDYLQISRYQDRSNNGLQVQGPVAVSRVAFAVDASLAAFRGAVGHGAQLLITHHGLFWSQPILLTGIHFERARALIEGGCGLYGAHIPLDAHPEVGNNIELARLLGLRDLQAWGAHQGALISWIGELPEPEPADSLYARLTARIGPGNRLMRSAAGMARRGAVLSGFGADFIDQAAAAGADTLVTGETSHTWHPALVEHDMNVLFGGHYQTEAIGPQALARHLERRFGLETVFVDAPTGL